MRQFTGKVWNSKRDKFDNRTPKQRIKDSMRPPDKKTLERRQKEKKAMDDALKKIEARAATRTSVSKNKAIKLQLERKQ